MSIRKKKIIASFTVINSQKLDEHKLVHYFDSIRETIVLFEKKLYFISFGLVDFTVKFTVKFTILVKCVLTSHYFR